MPILMDTGPWVALIDGSESRHGESVEWFRPFQGEIFSTEAVLKDFGIYRVGRKPFFNVII